MTNENKRTSGSVVLWGILAVIAVAILVLMVVGRNGDEAGNATTESTGKAVAVRTLTVAAEDVADTVVLPARAEPVSTVMLSAEKPGRVTEILADRGDVVEAGQVVARLDDRMWKSLVARAEVVHREAEKDFGRWQELRKTGSVSDHDFDAVAKARDLARIGYEQAKTDLSKCEVRTPIAGTVDDRYVERGEYVHEGGPVLKVVDISSVKLAVDVPERDVLAVKKGTRVGVTLSALPDGDFTGEVAFVSRAAEALSNSFRTEIAVDNTDGVIRGGMIAEVLLERGTRKNAIVLPLAAVVNRKGEHVVFVAKGGKAERRVVVIEPISVTERSYSPVWSRARW